MNGQDDRGFPKSLESLESSYRRFKANAGPLGVTVRRVPSKEAAVESIIECIIGRTGGIRGDRPFRVAVPPTTMVDRGELCRRVADWPPEKGVGEIEILTDLNRDAIEQADMGISEFRWAIAETGCIAGDVSGLHGRLVSMLPPVHLALVPTAGLTGSFAHALERIRASCGGQIPAYLAFVTGPSKTADIERELTVGVHGPGTLMILFVDR